jgi:hypothetical protein
VGGSLTGLFTAGKGKRLVAGGWRLEAGGWTIQIEIEIEIGIEKK